MKKSSKIQSKLWALKKTGLIYPGRTTFLNPQPAPLFNTPELLPMRAFERLSTDTEVCALRTGAHFRPLDLKPVAKKSEATVTNVRLEEELTASDT